MDALDIANLVLDAANDNRRVGDEELRLSGLMSLPQEFIEELAAEVKAVFSSTNYTIIC